MKRSFSKLSLLALPLVVTACQDYEPFSTADVEAVKNNREFNKVFKEDFGEFAAGHQWGFDCANALFSNAFIYDDLGTRSILKQDMNYEQTNIRITEIFGKPANITELEKKEVYAWFSNHKVNWTNTPTYYNGTSTRETTDGIAHEINPNFNYGSLANHNNTLGDCSVAFTFNFHNGWVQHVNSNTNVESVHYMPKGADDEANYNNNPDYPDNLTSKSINSEGINKASKMNYLYSWGFTEDGKGDWQVHLYDFNDGMGYGDEAFASNHGGQNAILITDADINTWTYDCSTGGSLKHDKYYVVYLEGDDYSGYYLGFDFESWGDNTENRIYADGICNDWIIKIGDAGDSSPYNPSRVFCEDLGGTFDMDFNDVVFDVEYRDNVAKITMKAAGGTLPISLWYGKKGEKGAYQLTKTINEKPEYEIHAIYGVKEDCPVNVGAENGQNNLRDIEWRIAFNGKTGTYWNGQENAQVSYDKEFSEAFNFQKINVYVYHKDIAEWVNIGNIEGSAPYKLCVSGSTCWLREFQNIKSGYPSFTDWVKNPTIKFWDKEIKNEYLYQSE